MSQVTHYTLPNGLTVLLKEIHTAPVISMWTLYRVGSRNERTGETGASHWVEHMMFKGTKKYPPGILDGLIDRVGGQWNAFTSHDSTMYYETLPAEHIDIALDLESDRMANALFDPDETESERTVILSERQGSENQPTFWLREEVRSTAFKVHGYHHEIIGDVHDLTTMTRDQLYAHYQRHYNPANAVLVLAGAFNTADMRQKIESYYGNIPSGTKPTLFSRPEPIQLGERRAMVERPIKTAFVMMSHRVPSATHPDWLALSVMDSILTGAGGSVDNKTSRLYGALVKSEICAGMSGGINETIDPYLYTFSLTLRDGHTHQEGETVLLAELDKLCQAGITSGELSRAKKQARANFAYETESITNQAYSLAQSSALGDHTWNDTYLARLEAITTDDVLDVARRYLIPQNRTVGWLIPIG
ncbi:MAG: pitrilysin family protein [bacterium]|nr:pitrilysin family protein [bacterium]